MVQSEAGQDIWNGKINSGDACVYFFGSVLVNERVQIFRVRVESGYQTFESEPGPGNFQLFYVESGYSNLGSGSSPGSNLISKMVDF